MSYKGYPLDGDLDAAYVLTSSDPNLVNASNLVPGPGIAIVVSGGQVTVSTTGGGAGSAATYITKNDERITLPNSIRLVQGANMVLAYNAVSGTLTLSSTASSTGGGGGGGTESYLTVLNESGTLANARQVSAGNNVFPTDNGSSNTYIFQVETSTADTSASIALNGTSNKIRLGNCTSNNIGYTLPAASSNLDKQFSIKKTDATANTITITPAGSDKIDGQASLVISVRYHAITIHCDGSSNWFIV